MINVFSFLNIIVLFIFQQFIITNLASMICITGIMLFIFQQLGTDIFGYKVLKEYRVNQYIAPDGSKPFGRAPDSQTVSVSWKKIIH